MFSVAYKRYVLMALTTVYMMTYLDRYLVALLLQPIKEDLLLSDTQLGFLTGIAFALFYATLGIPIARWADRGNRVTIMSIAIGMWGGMVMLCGLVTNFVQLMLVRIGAAVGEAGCMPPSYSLIGDYFQGRKHTRAMSIYMMGGPLNVLVSFAVAGWLNELYGWRVAFLLVGLPALLVAAAVRLTISEPRLRSDRAAAAAPAMPPLKVVFHTLWQQRSFRHLIMALVLYFGAGIGVSTWYAAFLTRSHGMGSGEMGMWLGLTIGLGGAAGSVLGGLMADRYMADNERARMRAAAVAMALLVPLYAVFLFVPHRYLALAMLAPIAIVTSTIYAPAFALMQRLVVSEMRATALAVTLLMANLIGMGFGPQAVGILSDLFAPTLGTDALRAAMFIVSFMALGSAYYFWTVGRTVREDLSAMAADGFFIEPARQSV